MVNSQNLIHFDSKESELRCRIAAVLWDCRKIMVQHAFMQLTVWLGCSQYIMPAERRLLQIERFIHSATDCFHLWKFCDLLECHFTLHEQELVWKLISES